MCMQEVQEQELNGDLSLLQCFLLPSSQQDFAEGKDNILILPNYGPFATGLTLKDLWI